MSRDEAEPGNLSAGSGATRAQAAEPAGFAALKSGLVIRQYVIEEVIGAGGFGITYRTRHQRLAAKVFALKEYFPREFAARSGTHVVSTSQGDGLFRWGLDRFLKEAEALAKCEHPGIVDVVDYFEENGTAYAVLGFVEGQPMAQWLQGLGRAPTQTELDRLLMPLLDALDAVHRAKLLHLDIAPDNIIVRPDGSPCLIDFGACREDIRERSRKVSAIVKHGYSPPEQYHGLAELQGPWTDIYALGATLYRAVSGAPPMDSSRRGALGDGVKPMAEMTEGEYRSGFMGAIDAALRLKPEERPQSVADWRAMLMASDAPAAKPNPGAGRATQVPSTSVPAATLVSRETTATGPGVRRTPVLVAAAGIALLLGLGAYALWGGSRETPPGPAPSQKTPAPPEVKRADAATSAPKSQPTATATPTLAPTPSEPEPPRPIGPDPEEAAAAAWRALAQSTDIAAIERFLATHGATAAGTTARNRLAGLQDAARKAQEQQAEAQREARWQACRTAVDADRTRACTAVIDGNEPAARRAEALHLRGLAHRAAGRLDAAIADFTRALELGRRTAEVHNDRGIARFLKGERDAAILDYGQALAIDPKHADALNNRAWSLLQASRAADALPDANRAVELAPGKSYVHDTRGHIHEALGRRDEAIRDYERALALDPDQADSRAGLDRLKPRN